MYNVNQIKKDLKNNLSDFRYEHCINVADEAKKLAKHYNFDEEKVYVAALVHDIAKEFSKEDIKFWIEKYNLSTDFLLPENKKIVHAEVGAFVVKELYKLDDEICNAVRYHTIGHVPMSLLDKIVFIADKIARDSDDEIIKKERILAYENIDDALILYLTTQKEKFKEKGKKMHPNSIELLNSLTQR